MIPPGGTANAQSMAQYQQYLSSFAHLMTPAQTTTTTPTSTPNGQTPPTTMIHPQMLQMYAFMYPQKDKDEADKPGESSQTESSEGMKYFYH
jgi:hypothetical protein